MTALRSDARKLPDWEHQFRLMRKAVEVAEDRLATLDDAGEATEADVAALRLLRVALALPR